MTKTKPVNFPAIMTTLLFGCGVMPSTAIAQNVPDAWAMECSNFDYSSSQFYITDVIWIAKDGRDIYQIRHFVDPLFKNFVAAQGQDPRYADCTAFRTEEEAAQEIKSSRDNYEKQNYPVHSLGAWHPTKPFSGTIATPSAIPKQPVETGKRDSIIVRQPDEAPKTPVAKPAPKPAAKAKPAAKPIPKKPLTQCGGKGQRRCQVKSM